MSRMQLHETIHAKTRLSRMNCSCMNAFARAQHPCLFTSSIAGTSKTGEQGKQSGAAAGALAVRCMRHEDAELKEREQKRKKGLDAPYRVEVWSRWPLRRATAGRAQPSAGPWRPDTPATVHRSPLHQHRATIKTAELPARYITLFSGGLSFFLLQLLSFGTRQ